MRYHDSKSSFQKSLFSITFKSTYYPSIFENVCATSCTPGTELLNGLTVYVTCSNISPNRQCYVGQGNTAITGIATTCPVGVTYCKV